MFWKARYFKNICNLAVAREGMGESLFDLSMTIGEHLHQRGLKPRLAAEVFVALAMRDSQSMPFSEVAEPTIAARDTAESIFPQATLQDALDKVGGYT